MQADLGLAYRMVVPQLLAHREGGTFEELPPASLALQSDHVLLLDHGTDVFIWTVRTARWRSTLASRISRGVPILTCLSPSQICALRTSHRQPKGDGKKWERHQRFDDEIGCCKWV